mmetsp:Transcript_56387/g.174913  ORF Transcript_56387/g.174913 Transcript_56387/m.174913 type:complete len:138 (-) Transcript_56387:84-497(-)
MDKVISKLAKDLKGAKMTDYINENMQAPDKDQDVGEGLTEKPQKQKKDPAGQPKDGTKTVPTPPEEKKKEKKKKPHKAGEADDGTKTVPSPKDDKDKKDFLDGDLEGGPVLAADKADAGSDASEEGEGAADAAAEIS